MRYSPEKTKRIAELNDRFRKTFTGGQVFIANSVAELPDDTKLAIFNAIQTFDDFNEENDIYGEHNFGMLTVEGYDVIWHIACPHPARNHVSRDPSNTRITRRRLLIMLAKSF